MEDQSKSREWYSSPWIIGPLVFAVLLAASCFAENLGPGQVFGAEARTEPDSTLVGCGTLTRMDSTRTDTTFGWIQDENGIRARPAFRFVSDTVEVGKKYEITYDLKHIVRTVKAVKKCTTPALTSAGGLID